MNTTKIEKINSSSHLAKRPRTMETSFDPIKIATAEAAAAVDADPPYFQMQRHLRNGMTDPGKGKAVLYWMRLADLRRMSLNQNLTHCSCY